MVISFVFFIYLCLIFVHIFFKSFRKMSTALKPCSDPEPKGSKLEKSIDFGKGSRYQDNTKLA